LDRVATRKNKDRLDRTIGKNIRIERQARSMSRDELAEALDLTVSHMGLIERGERGATALTLEKLANTFQITIDSLFHEPANDAERDKLSVKESDDYEVQRNRERIIGMLSNLKKRETEFVLHTIKGLSNLQPQDPLDNFDNIDFN